MEGRLEVGVEGLGADVREGHVERGGFGKGVATGGVGLVSGFGGALWGMDDAIGGYVET